MRFLGSSKGGSKGVSSVLFPLACPGSVPKTFQGVHGGSRGVVVYVVSSVCNVCSMCMPCVL